MAETLVIRGVPGDSSVSLQCLTLLEAVVPFTGDPAESVSPKLVAIVASNEGCVG